MEYYWIHLLSTAGIWAFNGLYLKERSYDDYCIIAAIVLPIMGTIQAGLLILHLDTLYNLGGWIS